MHLGMVDNEEFSEILSGSATLYNCDFTDLVCENLNSEKQIDMLLMVFANSAEDKLTWWRKLADKVNEMPVEELEKLKFG